MKQIIIIFLCAFTVITNGAYIIWRIFFTIPQDSNFISLFFAIGLLLAEMLGIFELFVYLHGAKNATAPIMPTVDQSEFPNVDVFVATYNEPADLLRKTLVSCKRMKYPKSKKVNIYLCDDGNRAEMHELAHELGIHYLNRSGNQGAKAGNLNNALKHSDAPLIATFDADMIPMEDFLMKTVPHFLDPNKKIGFVQTPQCFYNADLFQAKFFSTNRIPNEQDYFYRNVQLTKNYTNTVIYGGSNTLISRQALKDVGGFYEDSITEDFATGILIQSKGYTCIATEEPLASGLSPHDLKSLLKQRERWARGCIQTIKKLNIYTLKGLTLAQKINYTSSIFHWFSPIKRFFYIMCPIVFTVFGIRVIDATLMEILLFFIPTYLITNLTIKKYCNNIRNARWTNIYETITFPRLIKSVVLETFGISEHSFSVTSKNQTDDIDRPYHHRRAIPFYIYIGLSLIGIINVLKYIPYYNSLNFVILLFWLITNLLYMIMSLMFILEFNENNTYISYAAKVKFELANNEDAIHSSTTTISDTGFKFEMHSLCDLKLGSLFHANILSDSKKLKNDFDFQIKIKDIKDNHDKKEYTCEIVDIDTNNRDRWTHLLHNRLPSMPETIIDSKNIFHDLAINIIARCKRS